MKKLKRCFFVLVFGLLLGTAATFACSTECQADNAEAGFSIRHSSSTCGCNDSSLARTVIIGSTHTYTISPYANSSFQKAVWNPTPELNNNIDISSIADNGKTATIHFIQAGTYTLSVTMTDTNNATYQESLSINVVTEFFDDEYLNICTKKGDTVSITPQFLMLSEDYPDGTLTTITEYIEWNTSSISSMTPTISDGTLTFTPDQSGEYSVSATIVLPYPGMPNGKRMATTYYTIFVAEKEIETGKSITSNGQQNEYVSFTPNVTGRYKINWKSYSSSGNESLYDSKGNQVFRIDDYLGGYWLTKGETYCMKLYYKTPTNSNSYSIDLYTDEDSDLSTKPDPTPSVPSGQPSQGSDIDGNNDHVAGSNDSGNTANGNSNTGNVINDTNNTAAPTQTVSVSKVKGKPKLKLKKGKVKLTFKKVKGADGYEIRYATNKKFKKSKKITVKSPKATLKKLKKGKKYFVKIRAFKRTAASQKVYGAYSKVVKINVK